MNVGERIWFAEERRPYVVRACDDRYLVCTKPFNIHHTVLYTIVDLHEGIRGADNYWKWGGHYDYQKALDCWQCLDDLYSGEVEISRRNVTKLSIVRIEPVKKFSMKKINRDPFSNGTEHDMWEHHNCDKCWKSSHVKRGSDPEDPDYTPITCAIQRDIFGRMIDGSALISQRSYDICQMADCPYKQERKRKYEKYKNDPKLFDI